MIKMFRKANFLKNKIKLFITRGIRIKVGKNSYILFKKEDYMKMIYLERVYFDFFKKLLNKDVKDEDKIIRLFFRLSLIKNILKVCLKLK